MNFIRWWLTGILLFLPFQHNIIKIIRLWNSELTVFVNRLDKFTIIILLPLAIREFYKKKKISSRNYFILLFPVFALVIFGFISGMVNGNYMLVTIHGIFDYVKYFLVIFIYAAFFREFNEFKKVFRLLLIIAVFFGVVAFIQESWAMGNKYIFQKKITDIFYLDISELLRKSSYREPDWRIGIYRVPSLMINPLISGLYGLLIFTFYINIVKKGNFAVFFAVFSSIFGSVSRIVYTGFACVAGLQIFKGKKWLIAILIPIAILLFYLSYQPDFYIWKPKEPIKIYKQEIQVSNDWENKSYRRYTKDKAIEIWKDHTIWGVGPGMYGGIVSIDYKSPIYEKYNFNPYAREILESSKTIDQFWPQVLAESGIIGIGCFAWIFISLFKSLSILRKEALSYEVKGLFRGLIINLILILSYTFGSSLNVPPIIFTYFAFVGIGLGCGME